MISKATTSEWSTLFEEISIPRLVGSVNCDRIISRLAAILEEKGYDVQLDHFVAGPERLVGGSVSGLLLAVGSVVAAVILLSDPTSARLQDVAVGFTALILVVGLPALVAYLISTGRLYVRPVVRLLGYQFGTGRGDPGVYSVRTANITALKSANPRVWLVAHSDSKVQRNSLGARMVAVLLAAVGVVLVVLSGALHALGSGGLWMTSMTIIGAALAVFGGMVLAVAGLQDGSPGAIDNATGVVAALAAADELGWPDEVGILITGAEELAMAGAREWVKGGGRGGVFFNFDGVDGKGRYLLWVHKGASPGTAQSIVSLLRDTLGKRETWIVKRFMTFGAFVDGMILSRAGLAGVTVQRGTFSTAAVAHTPKDTPSRVDLEGALRAGRKAATVIEQMLTERGRAAFGV
jgi:hypothetical protein